MTTLAPLPQWIGKKRRRQIWPSKVLTKTILPKLAPDILLGPRKLLVNAGSGEMPGSRENGDQSQGGGALFDFCIFIYLHWLTVLWKRAALPLSAQRCNGRSTLGRPGHHRPHSVTMWHMQVYEDTKIGKGGTALTLIAIFSGTRHFSTSCVHQ